MPRCTLRRIRAEIEKLHAATTAATAVVWLLVLTSSLLSGIQRPESGGAGHVGLVVCAAGRM